MIKVWFDGACWPNPYGHSAYGVYIRDKNRILLKEGAYIGIGEKTSNNVAEYAGLIRALEYLKEKGLQRRKILVRGDSKLVIKQMSGKWKIKSGIYVDSALFAQKLVRKFKNLTFKWIPRENNTTCDELAENALLQRH